MSEHEPRDAAFAGYLERMAGREDRAALAALRRGLGKRPGEAPEMFPYLAPWTRGLDGWPEETYYLVASLFSLHPETWHRARDTRDPTNLGASIAWAAGAQREATERRFVALLSSHRDDLSEHLRHAVSFCASEEVPIDWLQMLRDLGHWDSGTRYVQRDWAGAFWRAPTEETSEETA